jgi:hypothetical protein
MKSNQSNNDETLETFTLSPSSPFALECAKVHSLIDQIKALLPSNKYLFANSEEGVVCDRHFSHEGIELLRFQPAKSEFIPLEEILASLK